MVPHPEGEGTGEERIVSLILVKLLNICHMVVEALMKVGGFAAGVAKEASNYKHSRQVQLNIIGETFCNTLT